jgi:hypothetical protein
VSLRSKSARKVERKLRLAPRRRELISNLSGKLTESTIAAVTLDVDAR